MTMIPFGLSFAMEGLLPFRNPVLFLLYPGSSDENEGFAESDFVNVNWLEEFSKGGITMIFLTLLSIFGVAVLIERLFALRKGKLISKETWQEIQESQQKPDWQQLNQSCNGRSDLLSSAVAFVLQRRNRSYQQVVENVSDFLGRKMRDHLAKVQLLSAVAGIAPLLGLLGTMIGMIESFKMVSVYGDEGGASILADSISKALITTAAGLVVAIPALAAFYWMRHRISGIASELEVGIDNLLLKLYPGESSAEIPSKIDESNPNQVQNDRPKEEQK